LFFNHAIQVEVCLIRKPNVVERYLIILSPKLKSLFNIRCTYRLDIPSCAAAFLVGLLGLLCSATPTASMLTGERTDEGRRRIPSNTEPSLLNWL
jgi:hypothetical protein